MKLPTNSNAKEDCKITVSKNGPILVSGGIPLFTMTIECDAQGTPAKWVIGKKLEYHRKLCFVPVRTIK